MPTMKFRFQPFIFGALGVFVGAKKSRKYVSIAFFSLSVYTVHYQQMACGFTNKDCFAV